MIRDPCKQYTQVYVSLCTYEVYRCAVVLIRRTVGRFRGVLFRCEEAAARRVYVSSSRPAHIPVLREIDGRSKMQR